MNSKEEQGTASFTELHIRSFVSGNPHTLGDFLAWPARLEVFIIDSDEDYNGSLQPGQPRTLGIWNYTLLSSVLQHNKKTLKHLGLGRLDQQEGINEFDIHDFGMLETLAIAFRCVPRPSDACRLWLTPTLHVLTIELYEMHHNNGSMSYRNEDVRNWFIEFAALAAAYKRNGSRDGEGEGRNLVALRKVELVLPGENSDRQYEEGERLLELEVVEAANQALLDAGFEIRVPDISVAEWKLEQQNKEQ